MYDQDFFTQQSYIYIIESAQPPQRDRTACPSPIHNFPATKLPSTIPNCGTGIIIIFSSILMNEAFHLLPPRHSYAFPLPDAHAEQRLGAEALVNVRNAFNVKKCRLREPSKEHPRAKRRETAKSGRLADEKQSNLNPTFETPIGAAPTTRPRRLSLLNPQFPSHKAVTHNSELRDRNHLSI